VTGAWTAAFVVLSFATLVSIVLQLGLVRRVSMVLEEMAQKEAGATATEGGAARGSQLPPFEIERADGTPMAFTWPGSSPSIFLFMEPGCAPCQKIAPALSGVADRLQSLPLYVVTPHESGVGWLPASGDFVRLLDRDEAAARAFRNLVSPQAFAVDRHGVVRDRKIVASGDDLSSLASRVWEEVGERIGN
jgi:thiol-disulfide isomerase/thioredoxin